MRTIMINLHCHHHIEMSQDHNHQRQSRPFLGYPTCPNIWRLAEAESVWRFPRFKQSLYRWTRWWLVALDSSAFLVYKKHIYFGPTRLINEFIIYSEWFIEERTDLACHIHCVWKRPLGNTAWKLRITDLASFDIWVLPDVIVSW